MFIDPEDTLKEAAQQMREIDCGVLPVGDKDDVEGIITDRDIVVRAIARGEDPAKEKVKDYMTRKVYGCLEHDSLKKAAEEMRKYNVCRLVVKDMGGAVTGILSFGHILRHDSDTQEIAGVLEVVARREAA